MREQPSKRAIELRLEWLNKALGRATTTTYKNGNPPVYKMTDAFYIDHCLGGYRLESAGQPVFGHQRMTKRELCDILEAILVAIKLARGEQSGTNWPQLTPAGDDCAAPELLEALRDVQGYLEAIRERLATIEESSAVDAKLMVIQSALEKAKGLA